MENVWKIAKEFLQRNLVRLLSDFVKVAGKIVDYFQCVHDDAEADKAEKTLEKAEKKVDQACDKGGIDDLFDAAVEMKKAKGKMKKECACACALAAALLCGCVHEQTEIPVVRPWEGRYESGKAAVQAAQQIELEKGESAWLLSSSTMKRLLKATKE